jgi:1,4-dihydroxy-2-naphthoyl-CoA hydrolase
MPTTTREHFQSFGAGHLPGHLGVEILTVSPQAVQSRLAVTRQVMAPNGYLHAAAIVALELKANFLGTAREGAILCR